MIKIKTKWNFEKDTFDLDYSHKNSCCMEHLALIARLVEEIMNNEGCARKDVFKAIEKTMDVNLKLDKKEAKICKTK